MEQIKRIMLIDDDPVVTKICSHIVKKNLPGMDICTFTCPEKGLETIKEEYTKNPVKTILLLDINMPGLSGWEVMNELEGVRELIKNHLYIYMFSSSVSYQDKALSSEHPLIIDFVEKPLTAQKLNDLLTSGSYLWQQPAA